MEDIPLPGPQENRPGEETPLSGALPNHLYSSSQPAPGEVTKYPFSFHGNGSEFFRIWIVNVALTVITFGIYTPWAKVRTRRYFYGNTYLNDRNFSYLANPIALLKGFLIIVGGLIAYNVSGALLPPLAIVIFLIFVGVFPWLIFKSIRFKCHNSAYSNVRLRFRGSCAESYGIYLGLAILVPLTVGLILPYQAYRARQYVFGNFSLGKSDSHTTITPGRFYLYYLVLPLALITGIAILASIAIPVYNNIIEKAKASANEARAPHAQVQEAVFAQFQTEPDDTTGEDFNFEDIGIEEAAIVAGVIAFYAVFFLVFALVQQYIFVKTTNYTLINTTLGSCRLYSDMRVRDVIWIFVSNVILILLTLGLYTPWALVRLRKYQIEHMAVLSHGDLQEFVAAEEAEQSAIGDAAGDYFDFEIGF